MRRFTLGSHYDIVTQCLRLREAGVVERNRNEIAYTIRYYIRAVRSHMRNTEAFIA